MKVGIDVGGTFTDFALLKSGEDSSSGRDEIVLWGDGSPTREFLYVDDAAEGILAEIEKMIVETSERLAIKRRPPSIFDYEYEDFEILNYEAHPHIKAAVAV